MDNIFVASEHKTVVMNTSKTKEQINFVAYCAAVTKTLAAWEITMMLYAHEVNMRALGDALDELRAIHNQIQ